MCATYPQRAFEFFLYTLFYTGTIQMSCHCRHTFFFSLYFLVKRNIFVIKKTLKDRICLYNTPHDACLAPRRLVFASQNGITLLVVCNGIKVTTKHLFVFKKFIQVLRLTKHRKSSNTYFLLTAER